MASKPLKQMVFGTTSTVAQDYEVPVPANDAIQDLSWSPTSNLLVDGGWDNNVREKELVKRLFSTHFR